jgi:hypothetical protein
LIQPIDLGVCDGYEWDGDPGRTAIVLPGAMFGGMPVNAFVCTALHDAGWRIVQVWEDARRVEERARWPIERAEAALSYAGRAHLVSGKSAGSLAAPFAAEHGLPAIWTTPLLGEQQCVDGLRARTAPALLVGGTHDPAWDGRLARELADEVCEIDGGDHVLARPSDLAALQGAVAAFSAGLRA